MICIITVIYTFISNHHHHHFPNLELFNARKIGTIVSCLIFSSLSAPILAFVTRVFVCNLYISRVFSTLFSPPPSSRVCTDTGHSRSLDYLLCPGSYSTECVSCSNPFSFYTIPLLSVCYSKSEWVCKVGGYHHAAQGSTSLIQFTCLYSFRDTRVIFTALFL